MLSICGNYDVGIVGARPAGLSDAIVRERV